MASVVIASLVTAAAGLGTALLTKPGTPDIPTVEEAPTEISAEQSGISSQEEERRKAAARRSRQSTILTGSEGVTQSSTGTTAILGG